MRRSFFQRGPWWVSALEAVVAAAAVVAGMRWGLVWGLVLVAGYLVGRLLVGLVVELSHPEPFLVDERRVTLEELGSIARVGSLGGTGKTETAAAELLAREFDEEHKWPPLTPEQRARFEAAAERGLAARRRMVEEGGSTVEGFLETILGPVPEDSSSSELTLDDLRKAMRILSGSDELLRIRRAEQLARARALGGAPRLEPEQARRLAEALGAEVVEGRGFGFGPIQFGAVSIEAACELLQIDRASLRGPSPTAVIVDEVHPEVWRRREVRKMAEAGVELERLSPRFLAGRCLVCDRALGENLVGWMAPAGLEVGPFCPGPPLCAPCAARQALGLRDDLWLSTGFAALLVEDAGRLRFRANGIERIGAEDVAEWIRERS